MTISRDNLLKRAAAMLDGEVIRVNGLTAPVVRNHLKELRRHWDSEVQAKRYVVKSLPDPVDRDEWRRIARGEVSRDKAVIMSPRGVVYVACGSSWPDYSGYPRAARPDLRPIEGRAAATMAGRKGDAVRPAAAPVRQDMPNYDDVSQVPHDWE